MARPVQPPKVCPSFTFLDVVDGLLASTQIDVRVLLRTAARWEVNLHVWAVP